MLASAAGAAAGAVAKAVAGGPTLPFETGEEVKSFAGKSCWKLHSGKKEDKATGKMQDVSLFLFDMKDRAPAEVAAAKNGMRRMRTIKHPYLLKCFDAGEVPDNKGGGVIWIATEPVQPLDAVIESLNDTPGALAWGVYTLAAAVNFLNMDASSIHGQARGSSAAPPPASPCRPPRTRQLFPARCCGAMRLTSHAHGALQVCITSIFVDKGMDWKLGGFEFLIGTQELDESYINNLKELLPKKYQSPELARGNLQALKQIPVAADWCARGCAPLRARARARARARGPHPPAILPRRWALGCTLFEIFCGPIRSPADLKNIQNMPEALRPDYMRLLSSNPAGRLRPIEMLQNPLFDEEYVSLQLFLETLNVKDAVEKDRCFSLTPDPNP